MNRPGEGSNPSSPPSDTSNDMKVAFSTGPWYPLRPDALREGFDGGQELENGVFVGSPDLVGARSEPSCNATSHR